MKTLFQIVLPFKRFAGAFPLLLTAKPVFAFQKNLYLTISIN
jgi:hypothetical protein